MKQQVAVSMAGLMLITAGCENADGKTPFSILANGMAQKSKPTKLTSENVGERNIHDQWQGRSNPCLYEGGFFVRGDFLYWRADEEGLDYGMVANTQPSIFTSTSTVKAPEVKWNAGFRLGLGYTFSSQDYWDLAAVWTRFNTHQTDSHSFNYTVPSGSGSVFLPWWGAAIVGGYANRASVDWDLNYNVYDLDLGRNYFVSKTMTVHPFVGLGGATIKQDYHAKYLALLNNVVSSLPTSFKAQTDFWGVGAHLGTALQWHMNSCFSLLGNVGGSLLYGDFKIKEQFNGLTFFSVQHPTTSSVFLNDHVTTGTVNLEAMVGFQWEKFFHKNKYRVSIVAGYEWSEWFSQNRLIKSDVVIDASALGANSFDRENGDLTLQGFNLQFRLDF